jgi:hypothetical protein
VSLGLKGEDVLCWGGPGFRVNIERTTGREKMLRISGMAEQRWDKGYTVSARDEM